MFVIIALALVTLGGGAYLVVSHRQTPAPTQTTTQSRQRQSSQAPQPSPSSSQDSTLANYVSNGKDLNLNFNYPSDWSVTPPTNSNTDDHAITVTSPVVSLDSATDSTATARIVVSIRPGGTAVSELAGDKATAAQTSEQIAYDKPTSAQHQYPYLTFIHLNGGSNPQNAFEEVMITGITSFAKDQAIPQASVSQFDPLITVRFYTCNDQKCSSSTPLSLTSASWNSDATTQQALVILKSLQIN